MGHQSHCRLLAFCLLFCLALAATASEPQASDAKAHASAGYGRLPLVFEANSGQTDAAVRFLARGNGYTVFICPTEAVLSLRAVSEKGEKGEKKTPEGAGVLRMKLAGAHEPARIAGIEALPGRSHYFIGNDPAKWHTDVAQFGSVKCEQVYAGIDLLYYGNQRQLEFDFIVAPGADPKAITLEFSGAEKIEVAENGDLVLRVSGREIRQHKPIVYQEDGIGRTEISGRYILKNERHVSFEVGAYDTSRALIIDPIISYFTFIGGMGDQFGNAIALDSTGAAYITGNTTSTDFPTAGPVQAANGGLADVFIAKLNPQGTALVYSTYLGAGNTDEGLGIAVDASGNACVVGDVSSPVFPTVNAAQPVGGGNGDGFVAKLNASGSALVFSTFLGGRLFDSCRGVAIDSTGNIYVTGRTDSDDFPKLNPLQAAITGFGDAFVTKFSPAGAPIYSTYLGGGSVGGAGRSDDEGNGIAVDSTGAAYVTGFTASGAFPMVNAVQPTFGGFESAFVSKINPQGTALVYSSYLGGMAGTHGRAVAVDGSGNCYIGGNTDSGAFTIVNALQPLYGGSLTDGFVVKLNPTGQYIYSTYIGGGGTLAFDSVEAIAADSAGNAYVAGFTDAPDFPVLNEVGADDGGRDGFVAKINPAGSALVYSSYIGSVVQDNAAGVAVDAQGSCYVVGSVTVPSGARREAGAAARAANTIGPIGMSGFVFVLKLEVGSGPAAITSPLTATGTAGMPFFYVITATGAEPMTFTASPLPPGIMLNGSTLAGVPTQVGTFTVTLSASNSLATDTKMLVIAVTGPSSTNDADGDGFSDALEIGLGLSSPFDPDSTPFGGSPAGTPKPFAVLKKSIKLNFADTNKDSVSASGTLPVPVGLIVAGQGVAVDFGGVIKGFLLDAKGASPRSTTDTFKLRVKAGKGVVLAQDAKFQFKFKNGNYAALFADEGLLGTLDVKAAPHTVRAVILFNLTSFETDVPVFYTARKGKSGSAK